MSYQTPEEKRKQINTVQDFLNRFLKAIQTGENFVVNGTFEDGGKPHAVFLAGGFPSKEMINTMKINSKIIIDHLEGKKSVDDAIKEGIVKPRKDFKLASIKKNKDGGVTINFNS